MRPKLRVIETFDPTPQEIESAERAKPLKLPLCIKCKLRSSLAIADTARQSLSQAFLSISNLLTSQKAGRLTHADVERIKQSHKHLSRASKGRYCETCFENAIIFSNQILSIIQEERLRSR